MTLTAQEAKDKCIAMWEHIAANITDKEWRDAARKKYGEFYYSTDVFKRFAIHELYPQDDPRAQCYFCHYRCENDIECPDFCPLNPDPLDVGQCCNSDEPFGLYCIAVENYHYARAAKAAQRLVEQVRAWEGGVSEMMPVCLKHGGECIHSNCTEDWGRCQHLDWEERA